MKDKSAGYLRICQLLGVPMFIHWSFPIVGVLISVFVGFELGQTFFYSCGFFLVIAVHELGHATMAYLLGLNVLAIHISAAGGVCQCAAPQRNKDALLLYSGGVIAQILLYFFSVSYVAFFGYPDSLMGSCIINSFTLVNFLIFMINIVPYKASNGLTSDGYNLWAIFIFITTRNKTIELPLNNNFNSLQVDTSLLSLDDFMSTNINYGIKIQFDYPPHDELINNLLVRFVLNPKDNIRLKNEINKNRVITVPMRDRKSVESAINFINLESKKYNQNLTCKLVSSQQLQQSGP